jgi:hypothetical protein
MPNFFKIKKHFNDQCRKWEGTEIVHLTAAGNVTLQMVQFHLKIMLH